MANPADQIKQNVTQAVDQKAADVRSKLHAEEAKLKGFFATHSKTLIVVAFIVGLFLGFIAGASSFAPKKSASGATAAVYAAPVQMISHDFRPYFVDGGVQGNG